MSPPRGEDRREAILEASLKRFSQYGYRRTSMDDIANEAGVSRPALYLHFANKEDVFRTLSKRMHEAALERAQRALAGRGRLRLRLRRAFEGWALEFVALVYSWPDAGELIDASHRVGADISRDAQARFERLLASSLRRAQAAGEIDLSRIRMSARRAAQVLLRASHGFKDPGTSSDAYRARLDGLLRIFEAAVTPE